MWYNSLVIVFPSDRSRTSVGRVFYLHIFLARVWTVMPVRGIPYSSLMNLRSRPQYSATSVAVRSRLLPKCSIRASRLSLYASCSLTATSSLTLSRNQDRFSGILQSSVSGLTRSSTVQSSAFAISASLVNFGEVRPVSHCVMLSWRTPIISASCHCASPLACRIALMLIFITAFLSLPHIFLFKNKNYLLTFRFLCAIMQLQVTNLLQSFCLPLTLILIETKDWVLVCCCFLLTLRSIAYSR